MRIRVNIPEGVSGDFHIEHIKTDNYCGTKEPLDTYTVLFNSSHNIMQDTTREFREHEQFLLSAHGDVVVAGLGIGLVNQSLMQNPNVTSITIVEKYQEVIDLVWKHCPKTGKIRLVHADIYDWKPDSMFDIGWFDSWCGETDHEEYKEKMKERYGPYVRDIRFWESFREKDENQREIQYQGWNEATTRNCRKGDSLVFRKQGCYSPRH